MGKIVERWDNWEIHYDKRYSARFVFKMSFGGISNIAKPPVLVARTYCHMHYANDHMSPLQLMSLRDVGSVHEWHTMPRD